MAVSTVEFVLSVSGSVAATGLAWGVSIAARRFTRKKNVKAFAALIGDAALSPEGIGVVYPVFNPPEGPCGELLPFRKVHGKKDVRVFRDAPPEVMDIHDMHGVFRVLSALRSVYGTDVDFISDEDPNRIDWWECRSLVTVGGPLTNLVLRKVLQNTKNPLVTMDDTSYTISVQGLERTFRSDDSKRVDFAVLACLPNPVNAQHRVIVCAGLGDVGTEAACIRFARMLQNLPYVGLVAPFVEVLEVAGNDPSAPSVVESLSFKDRGS